MKQSQPFWKYLLRREGERCLHVVARKGGGVIYTLCGGGFSKFGARTLTSVPVNFYVCSGCAEAMK